MLRVVQNRSAAGAKSYFSQESYYSEGQELAGTWGGKLAKMLGLSGLIEQKDFDALCDNMDPRSNSPLTVRNKSNRTVGYDFNFHCPKGVSLEYAIRGDERILKAFEASVSETMLDIERDTKTRVRLESKHEDRLTGNLAWGQFIHKTARPVDGLEDPHLHAHCFVFNATFDEKEKRFKAAQFRDLKRHAPYYEALFHSRLSKRLHSLGYGIKREGRSWDLAGVPKELKSQFSKRTERIEAEAKRRGITEAERKAELGAKTREAKQKDRSFPELQGIWRTQLDKAGEKWRERPLASEVQISPEETHQHAKRAMEAAVSHCFTNEAVIEERKLHTEALRRGFGYVEIDDIVRHQQAAGVIARDMDGRRMTTTHEAIRQEREILDFARRGRGTLAPLNSNWKGNRKWLSDEQKQAVHQLVTSKDRVQVLIGNAGTGKTTLMHEAIEAMEAGKHRVFTFAPSSNASKGVLREEGFANATTVAELLINTDLQNSARGAVWWIDEAGLLPTEDLHRVMTLANQKQARLILGGDWKQHGSVQRGGVFKLLEQQAGLKAATVDSIRRQTGEYRTVVEEIAAGKLAAGYDRLDKMGWVREVDQEELCHTIAKDYANELERNRTALVVSPTNSQGRKLTAAIRQELRDRKHVAEESKIFVKLEPLHYTESERRDAAFYQPGHMIVFHQNAPGHRKGERILVTSTPDSELLNYASRFSVYRTDYLSIAQGDRVRFTANVMTKDGQHRLHNGTCYTVKEIAKSGDIVLHNGWTVGRDVGFIDFGYVSSSHASQGQTVDHVMIAESAESFAATGREQFYVSVSRGRKRATVYVENKDELRSVIQRSQAKITATEFFQIDHERARLAQQHEALQEKRRLTAPVNQPAEKTKELEYGLRQ